MPSLAGAVCDGFLLETSKYLECVETTLADASLSPQDVDGVFLTGGSSYIVCLKQYFEELFGKEKINHQGLEKHIEMVIGDSERLSFENNTIHYYQVNEIHKV